MKSGATHSNHKHYSHMTLEMESCNSCCMCACIDNIPLVDMLYAQSMDLHNPWIVLYKVVIDALHNVLYGFVTQSMDCPLGTLRKV